MITEETDRGEVIVNDGKSSMRLQDYFDAITRHINENKSPIYTVATVPDATKNESMIIYVSDESGGATLAFSNGVNWLRLRDSVIIS